MKSKTPRRFLIIASIIIFLLLTFSSFVLAESNGKEIGENYPDRVTLAVVRVINPGFPALKNDEFKEMLREIKRLLKKRMGVSLIFKIYPDFKIANFVAAAKVEYGAKLKEAQKHLGEFRILSRQDPSKLSDALTREYQSGREHYNLSNLIKFFAKAVHFSEKKLLRNINGIDSYMKTVADLHFEKYKKLEKLTFKNGKTLLEKHNGYNDFLSWYINTAAFPEYDFILTNQLIADIEAFSPTVHTSLRGGITAGTALSTNAQYGSTTIVSSAPIILNLPYFTKERGKNYSRKKAVKIIAAIAAHEFGHALVYRGHYYDHPGCLMNPTIGLMFSEWYDDIMKIEKCKKRHEEDLKSIYLRSNE